MKTSKKFFGLIACSVVLAGTAVIGTANLNTDATVANATEVTFEMVDGAQVKFGEDAGIRFAATVSKSYLDTLGETVTLVSSIDKKDNAEANESIQREWVVKGENSTYVENYETNTYYHAISFTSEELQEQLKEMAAVELTATMWLVSDGEKVAGSEQSVTRAMRAVANAAYEKAEDKKTELDKYFGERKTAVKAYKEIDGAWVVDGGITATAVYDGAKAMGADLTKGETLTGSYALFDANYNVYNVPAIVYATKIIDEASDLDMFKSTTTAVSLNGYYAVVKDIDYEGVTFRQHLDSDGGMKLAGTFDGNGHTISNIKIYGNGLFYFMNKGSIVKNLALTGVTMANNYTNYILGLYMYGTVENVYVQVNNATARPENRSGDYALVGTLNFNQGGNFQNVLIDMLSTVDITTLRANVYSVYQTSVGTDYSLSSNVHVISNGTNKTLKNVTYYASIAEMNEVSTDYWEVKNGVVTWKGNN